MPKTVFSRAKLFQQVTLNFIIEDGQKDVHMKDSRGNLETRHLTKIPVTFGMKPNSKGSDTRQDRTVSTDTYTGYVVSDEGKLPGIITIGMVGVGELNNRYIEAKVTSLQQSMVSPIANRKIGDVVQLEVYYKTIGKS